MNHDRSIRALMVKEANGAFHDVQIRCPDLEPDQVLVRVHASGVNPLDTKIRAGAAEHAQHPLPAVLGMDLAGTIEAVGEDVLDFAPGDEVYGMTGGVGGLQGSMAQYAVVDPNLLARKPENISMREAAALPLIVITAWEGLVDRAHTRSDQRVLIHGGAGGVGHVAVQIARSIGAEVFATVEKDQADIVRGYGAVPIDFRAMNVDEYVHKYTGGEGFDVIYDTVGGPVLDASFAAVKRYEGHVVSCLGWGTHKLAPLSFRGGTYSGVFTLMPMLTGRLRARHGRILELAGRLVENGQLRPRMDERSFTFENAHEAHELVSTGQGQGKIVIDVHH